jgi:hypothetical protein
MPHHCTTAAEKAQPRPRIRNVSRAFRPHLSLLPGGWALFLPRPADLAGSWSFGRHVHACWRALIVAADGTDPQGVCMQIVGRELYTDVVSHIGTV